MGHPDFRVMGKIFATLFKRDGVNWGMVKLTSGQQRRFIKAKPGSFEPCAGAWGRQGATQVMLKSADKASVKSALLAAWCNMAPKRLVEEHTASGGG